MGVSGQPATQRPSQCLELCQPLLCLQGPERPTGLALGKECVGRSGVYQDRMGLGPGAPWGLSIPPSHLPCSAGGTGVLLNVDRVAEQLQELGHPAVQVRGLVDSGWFLDNKQYRRTDCIDTVTCAPTEAIRRGIR